MRVLFLILRWSGSMNSIELVLGPNQIKTNGCNDDMLIGLLYEEWPDFQILVKMATHVVHYGGHETSK
jgi:hypothetical protein